MERSGRIGGVGGESREGDNASTATAIISKAAT